MVKINWDATIDGHNKKMEVRVIIRDAEGFVRASMCTSVLYIIDPTVAEAVAAWKAITLVCELGFQRVLFEGDALKIVLALCNGRKS